MTIAPPRPRLRRRPNDPDPLKARLRRATARRPPVDGLCSRPPVLHRHDQPWFGPNRAGGRRRQPRRRPDGGGPSGCRDLDRHDIPHYVWSVGADDGARHSDTIPGARHPRPCGPECEDCRRRAGSADFSHPRDLERRAGRQRASRGCHLLRAGDGLSSTFAGNGLSRTCAGDGLSRTCAGDGCNVGSRGGRFYARCGSCHHHTCSPGGRRRSSGAGDSSFQLGDRIRRRQRGAGWPCSAWRNDSG